MRETTEKRTEEAASSRSGVKYRTKRARGNKLLYSESHKKSKR